MMKKRSNKSVVRMETMTQPIMSQSALIHTGMNASILNDIGFSGLQSSQFNSGNLDQKTRSRYLLQLGMVRK